MDLPTSSARRLSLAAGPLLAAAAFALVLGLEAGGIQAAWTAAVTVLCSVWWIAEPIPIPATSLIPLAVFPLVGVLDHEQAAAAYGNTLVLLFMGGFIAIGGEWFQMWKSEAWNGLDPAFRNAMLAIGALIAVHLPSPHWQPRGRSAVNA